MGIECRNIRTRAKLSMIQIGRECEKPLAGSWAPLKRSPEALTTSAGCPV
jgi:hypothetical protein